MEKRQRAAVGWIALAVLALAGAVAWLLLSRDASPPDSTGAAQDRETSARVTWNRIDPYGYGAVGTDGERDEVAAFRIYVGPAPDELELKATVPDPQATSYVVEGLPPGKWYYSVTTVTRRGIESERPPPVAKTSP